MCHAVCHHVMLCVIVLLCVGCYVVLCTMQISDVEVKQRLDKLTEELHQNESLTKVSDVSSIFSGRKFAPK